MSHSCLIVVLSLSQNCLIAPKTTSISTSFSIQFERRRLCDGFEDDGGGGCEFMLLLLNEDKWLLG